jgi:uncharacterized protein (DUF58 family)
MRSWGRSPFPSSNGRRAYDHASANGPDEGRARSYFFNTAWIYGSALLLVLGMALRQPALSILAFLTLLTAASSRLWSRHSLDGLTYTRTVSENRVFRGVSVTLTTSLTNRKWLPLPWLEVEDQVSDRMRVRNQETLPSTRPGTTVLRLTTSVRWFERVSWTFEIDCPQRGAFHIGPVSLRSGDLFGFFSQQQRLDQRDRILVYPQIVPLEEIGLPPRHPFGDIRTPRHHITDASRTVGIREYRPEDSFRFVHWKATARLQELQVKVFEPTVAMQLGIFLNLDTYERPWEGIDYVRAESAITAAASLATHGIENRYLVGMYANGVLAGSDQSLRIRPGLNPDQLPMILEGLAKLTPLAATNFQRILRDEARRFPGGSTIVVISALMTESLTAALAEVLESGHRVTLLKVGEVESPDLPGLAEHQLPGNLIGSDPANRAHYARMITAHG